MTQKASKAGEEDRRNRARLMNWNFKRICMTNRVWVVAFTATLLAGWPILGESQGGELAAQHEPPPPAAQASAANNQGEPFADVTESDPATAALYEAKLISNVRQLTFEGARAGEGYFSRDGSRMVFQSEREPGNPFFQIYLLDLESGDTVRVSPGHGKTTCGWIHPDGNRVLFASTHDDPDARKKQADELELRKSGQQRRYSWDYDSITSCTRGIRRRAFLRI
jgi:hypothetical protein